MLDKIPIYELPFTGNEKPEFKIYQVQGVEIQRKDYPHKTELPHKHSYFEVCFFSGGSGEHEIDFKNHKIESPAIHYLQPGQVHVIRRGKEYRGYLLVFSEEFFNLNFENIEVIPGYPLVSQLENGPILNLNKEQFEEFFQLIRNIEKELTNHDKDSEEIIISYLKIFFLKLRQNFSKLRTTKNEASGNTKSTVYRFNRLVEENYCQVHHVKEYAGLLGETPAHLNRAVKAVTGKTAGEIIIERLMLEARRLLIYSDLSNKEIAYKLNYDDPSYFARIFRKKTGQTPSSFRLTVKARYH
ncbi:MAG: AraC family transcriptional regulator [Bacteroidota bacterium]